MSSRNDPERSSTPPERVEGWSLAGRLTLWYAAYSFVFIVAFAAFLYGAFLYKLETEDDHFMAEKAELVRILLRDRFEAADPLVAEQAPVIVDHHATIYLRVLSQEGRTLLVSEGMDDLLPVRLFPDPTDASTLHGLDLWIEKRSFRLATMNDDRRIVQVAMDRTQEKQVIAAFRWYLGLALGVVLIGCITMGYWIARRGLKPVVAIADAASRIRSSTLNERIDVTKLPTELLTLAETFNAMLDRLEQSFARLRHFSANLAHELRTPINNVRGEIEVTLGKPRSTEEYREVLGSNLEECARLADMIDSMLFLARVENQQMQIERERLEILHELQCVCEFYEAAASEADVRLAVVGEPVHAWLSRSLFQRALANLVTNALAHTPRGGGITLSVHTTTSELIVAVADTGQGIPPEHLPHVFDRFYRVDAARSSTTNVGLGLAIVRSIIELLGGTVRIDSEVGRGTCIEMTFPHEISAESSPPRSVPPESQRGLSLENT